MVPIMRLIAAKFAILSCERSQKLVFLIANPKPDGGRLVGHIVLGPDLIWGHDQFQRKLKKKKKENNFVFAIKNF